MDLDRDNNLGTNTTNSTTDRQTRVYDRDTREGGSNFLPFLIGGLVIAVGLLAFLFYDGGNSTDPTTTGSTGQPSVSSPATPSATGTTPAPRSPAAPATPASPARPANPQ